MPKRHKTPWEVIALQQYGRTAKQCEAVIALGILRNIFNVSDKYLIDFYDAYKQETAKYNCWAPQGAKKAEADFRGIAKRYNLKIRPAADKLKNDRDEKDAVILYTECTCLYVTLRILYDRGDFNYKMLDEFVDRYIEFNQIYDEGEQTDILVLSDELEDIIGFNIFRGGKHGN